ncbi:MAG TPA: MFS transporter [Acidisarcina sp.]|nr:MFS transporter [Acidisarcina sp.]
MTAKGQTDSQPVAGLLALAMTGFIAILTETMPAGLLPQIGAGLHVSPALAGQMVSLYAVGSLVAAIPVTAALQGWRRRPRLLLAVLGFLIFNTITALSSSYPLTLVSRFLAGVAAGLGWGIIPGYARLMASGENKGRSMAIAMVGTPLALALGVPAGTFVGKLVTWRTTFLIMSCLALVLIFWILLKVPNYSGRTEEKELSVGQVILTPGVRPILAVIFFWMVAHNILYTYASQFVAQANLGSHIDVVLLVFGMTSLAGIWIIGLLVDRWLRPLVLLSIGGFMMASLCVGIAGRIPIVVYASVTLWGLTFGGAATLLQTALADAAGDGVDLAQALNTTTWNLAIAGGGMIGGALIATAGVDSFAWVSLALLTIALLLAWKAKANGFPVSASNNTAMTIERTKDERAIIPD